MTTIAELPFVSGSSYPRQSLKAFVGDTATSMGVIVGPERPDVVLITSGGRNARKAGYQDRQELDGSWTIHAQGQKGHQDPQGLRNPKLLDPNRVVLLFRTHYINSGGKRESRERFVGPYLVGGWDYEIPKSGKRKGHRLIAVRLFPIDAGVPSATDVPSADDAGSDSSKRVDDLDLLREEAARRGGEPLRGPISRSEYRRASRLIRLYAEMRANGTCEYRGCTAPFTRPNGKPYLEVHHIFRLADDGPDLPANVAALCPNCHREAHFGPATSRLRDALAAQIATKEAQLVGT
jgi:5-methylcytosine-specific restriction enzyme A